MGKHTDGVRQSLLVLRAQAGDRAALSELLAAAQERLYRVILRVLGRRTDAEDALQDVLVIVCRKLTWLSTPELFDAWSYRIATREAVRRGQRLRQEQVRLGAFALDWSASGGTTATALQAIGDTEEGAALRDDLAPLIEQLSPNSRAVIVLHYYEKLALREVAEILALPIGTVKSRLADALRRLRIDVTQQERLEKNGDGNERRA